MALNDRGRWVFFGDFFEEVSIRGIDEITAAEALHSELKQHVQAFGYRRLYETGQDQKTELLPRDTQPQRLPIELWREVGSPRSDLTSNWIDDPDDPEQWIEVDWISGSLKSVLWQFDPIDLMWREYQGIRISERAALKLLDELAGMQPKRPGRPPGPADPWERAQAQRGYEMIVAGDRRADTQIAANLTNSTLPAEKFEHQKKRILKGIRHLMRASENSPAK